MAIRQSPLLWGGWTWFSKPVTVRDANKTYFAGVDGRTGDLYIGEQEHSTGAYAFNTLKSAFEVDDHSCVSLHIRPDGKIIAFYTGHNLDDILRWRISTNAGDISSFEAEKTYTVTGVPNGVSYVVPREAPNGDIFLFYNPRSTDAWDFVKSTDNGESFGSQTVFIDSGDVRTYCVFGFFRTIGGSPRLDLALTQTGTDTGTTAVDVAHCYFDGSSLYDSAGNVFNSGSLGVSDSTIVADTDSLVWDSSAQSKPRAWVWDCATFVDGSGNPRPEIVFTYYDHSVNPSHEYRWARWNGNGWDVRDFVSLARGSSDLNYWLYAAQEGYAPGLSIDPSTPGKLIFAEHLNDTDHGAVSLAEAGDATGTSWTLTNILPEDPDFPDDVAIRPYFPVYTKSLDTGPDSALPYVWLNGRYDSFTDFDTRISSAPGVARPDWSSADFSDAFTDTNGTNLHEHVPSQFKRWVALHNAPGHALIENNQCRLGQGVGGNEDAFVVPVVADEQFVQCDLQTVSSADGAAFKSMFLAVRVLNQNNWIGVRVYKEVTELYKRVGGAFTLIDSNADNLTGTYRLEVDASDNVTLKRGGSVILGPVSVTGVSFSDRMGLLSRSDDFSNDEHLIDNFVAGSLSTATSLTAQNIYTGAPTIASPTLAVTQGTVTMAAKDATGADIPDQTGVFAWVYSHRAQAPDAVLTNQSISAGQLVLDVSGLTDGTAVHVIAELSNGDIGVDDSSVVYQ